jgi:methyl-accepting chemotaxis protein
LHLALTAILTLSLVFISVLAWFLVHTVTTSIGKVIGVLNLEADELGSAVTQIAANSRTVADGASKQVSSVARTSASLRQMASMTKQNAAHAQEAKVAGNDARVAAHAGAENIKALTSAMDNVGEAGRSVSKIIGLIDAVAFETNMVALNAAVEAARAGAAGASFGVVADAVRNLAKRSTQAARETADKITDSIQKSDQGVLICAEVTKRLSYIAGKSREVDEIVGHIAKASQEQNQGIERISADVGEVEAVAQSNSGAVNNSLEMVGQLNEQAITLKQTIADLVKFVGH